MKSEDILIYVIIAGIIFACGYMYYKKEGFELKCIVSTLDGNKYCVRDREKLQEAADLLAKVTEKCHTLVKYIEEKYPDQENVQRLVQGFNPKKIMET